MPKSIIETGGSNSVYNLTPWKSAFHMPYCYVLNEFYSLILISLDCRLDWTTVILCNFMR